MLSVAGNESVVAEDISIRKLVEVHTGRNSRAVALEGPGCNGLTYATLQNHIDYTVDWLNAAGIGRTDCVALVLPNGPEMALAFLAIASGTTCAPLNPGLTESEFEFYLSELKPKALVVHSSLKSSARSVAQRYGIGIFDLTPLPNSEAGTFELTPEVRVAPGGRHSYGFAEPDDIALVLHTSGTTAKAKMVFLPHRSICMSADNIRSTFFLTEDDRCLNVMPLFHVHGLIGALLSSVAAGGSVVCSRAFDPSEFFTLMQQFRPTWYTAVPTIHQAILARAETNREVVQYNRLRFIRSCSAPLPAKVMQDLEHVFRTPVVESYGMTEAAHQITSNPLPPYERRPGSVGTPAGPEVAIMDESGNLLEAGNTGEIVIRGATVIRGYIGNSQANDLSFRNSWFRTGDQGFIDDAGYLFINGRIKELINRGGEKISPREIEEVLLDHPAVEQAIAFSVPHPSLGEDAYAAVVLRSDSTVTEQSILTFTRTRLSPAKAPRRVRIVAAIPKGATGKPQRVGMAERLGITAGREAFVAPENSLEHAIAEVWKQVLKIDRIGACDDFFELGGDSLKAAEVVRQLEQKFAIIIPKHLLLQANTVRAIAGVVVAEPRSGSKCLIPLQPNGSKPPFFLISSLGWEPFAWRNLPHYMDPQQPIYVLKSRGLDGTEAPHDRIEEMAANFIDELQTVDPDGPYFVGGYSSGGVVALEMAQQLRARGKQVALLALIDTRLSQNHQFIASGRRPQSRISRLVRNLDDGMGFLLELYAEQRLSYVIELLRSMISNALPRKAKDPEVRVQHRVFEASQRAVKNYMPQHYAGRLTFFMCDGDYARSSRDSRLAWSRISGDGFDLHVLPGTHLGLLQEDSLKSLAERLTVVIQRSAMLRMPNIAPVGS
jgi:acyl-CoA synthetase (AMP-forming)/AMP-acid ligase II/thioesterase domain-containing protein/acyl carrier protein